MDHAQSAPLLLVVLAHAKAHLVKVDSVTVDRVKAHHAKVDSVTVDLAQQAHAMEHHALQPVATAVHAMAQPLVQEHHAQVDHVKVVSAVHVMVSQVVQRLQLVSLTVRQRAKSATNTGATKSPGSKLPTRIGFTSINRSAIPKIMIPPVALISCTIRSVRIASRPEAPSVIRP